MLQCYQNYSILPKQIILDWATTAEESLKKEQPDEDNDEEEADEVLEVVGVEMRTKFLAAMQNYLNNLKEADKESDSDSSSEGSSSSSSSDDSDKKGKKAAPKTKAAQSSSSSEDSSNWIINNENSKYLFLFIS